MRKLGPLLIVLLLAFLFMSGCSQYNGLVTADENVKKAWSNVQTQYQRRADVFKNVVETVKAAAENEKEILVKVTQARAGIVNAKTPEDLDIAGREINTAINLAFEAYPQIRSTENFQDLQAQLEGTENRINVSRQRFNDSVKEYNSYIRGYFKKMALNFFGGDEDFSVRKPFESSAGADVAPTVNFN